MATVSAGLKGEFDRFPYGALLMLVLGFAVRGETASAIDGLLRLALDLAVDRRSDFILLGFLAMGAPVDGAWCKSVLPKKGSDARGAPLCLSSS
ncbi:MAG: hypothetical protein EHM67_17645 [Hyphomicrobiaceae bacterium]|nr:MAG: hypothetical protein EHM67_17645 [Hyphomicrobiaceae bacterium]